MASCPERSICQKVRGEFAFPGNRHPMPMTAIGSRESCMVCAHMRKAPASSIVPFNKGLVPKGELTKRLVFSACWLQAFPAHICHLCPHAYPDTFIRKHWGGNTLLDLPTHQTWHKTLLPRRTIF